MVAYLPYLFGFELSDSLVAVSSQQSGFGPASRIDLVDDSEHQQALVERQLMQLRQVNPRWCDLVLFGDSKPARFLARKVAERIRRDVGTVQHVVFVRPASGERPARWLVASCRCGRGCRRGWGDVPSADRVPLIADLVLEGRSPLSSRAELEASVRPRPLVSRAVAASAGGAPIAAERYAHALASVLDLREDAPPVDRLPVTVLADVLTGLLDLDVRDHLMDWLVPGQLRELSLAPEVTLELRSLGARPWQAAADVVPEVGARMGERLRGLVTCAPESLCAAPATLLGYWSWSHGDGALASVALVHALENRPGYRLAELVLQLVESGMSPQDLRRAACPEG